MAGKQFYELDPATEVRPTDRVAVQRGTDPAQRATVNQLRFGTEQAASDAEATREYYEIMALYTIAQAV